VIFVREGSDPGGQDELTMSRLYAVITLCALLALPAGVLAAGGTQYGAGTGGTVTVALLTADEVSWLQYMREEEKLARDVYLALYAKWKMPIFSTIAASEQKHMDATKALLDRYGVTDPAAGNGPGVFDNEEIQKLYSSLMEKGFLSKKDALEVGVIIEETDIDDLTSALGLTSHTDITITYTNLRLGSYNHLSAFNSQLAKY
jgi:hypothetical protein